MPEAITIDAEIRNATIEDWGGHRVIIGAIYNDTKGRFRDGDVIHTSAIVEELPEGVYRTRNSAYKVALKPPAWKPKNIPNVDETPEPELKWFRVVVLQDAYVNYETMVEAHSREEARDLVDSRDYDGRLVEVGTSEYDDQVVELDNVSEVTAEEAAEFNAELTTAKLIVAEPEDGDPGPDDQMFPITRRQHAAILAGLRLLQANGKMDGIGRISTNDGEFEELNDEELGKLCEALNG